MKKICTLLLVLGVAFNLNAQKWTLDQTSLYYWTESGKVFMQPDYTASAVYFKEQPTEKVTQLIRQDNRQSANGTSPGELKMDLMPQKGMLIIHSMEGLYPIRSSQQSKAFISNYQLNNEGAYEVLPAFTIGDKQAWFSKRVIVRLKDGYNLNAMRDLLSKYDANVIKNITNNQTYLLSVDQIENQLSLIHELHDSGILKWGEPDFKVELKKYIDPKYSEQWHLNNTGGSIDGKALVADVDIDAPEAWGITTGNSSVVVAVIDDGMEAHEDFAPLLTGYTPANGGDGTPSVSGDGHGQAVGGLIGAQHNEIGVRGVSPGVSMFSINIFAPGTTNADVADGINWAVNNGADVLSNSWGFGSCTFNVSSITDAFNNAANNGRGGLGCIILVASGNDFGSCVSYPADLPSVTAVGGVSGDGERSHFSNYGPTLDIVAPSDDDWVFQGGQWFATGTHGLRTTDRMGSNGWASGSSNYYDFFGGTSGATPQVSGVAALVLSVNPTLTKAQVESILYTTADDMGPSGFDNEYGNGRVNAHQAVLAAGGSSDTTPPSVPTNVSASNETATTFDLSWTASTDDTGVTSYNIYLNGGLNSSSAGTSATVSGLSPSTTYSVTVTALDAAGNESGQSNAINATTTAASLSCSTTISSYPYTEGFEAGDGWTQVTGDDGNWVNYSGSTPSSSTGPSSAAQGSNYMYLEASTNGTPGQIGPNATAILESPCFDLSGSSSATFSFQYHMYGSNMGTLTLQTSVDDINWNSAWSLSGDQGNAWNAVNVDLASFLGGNVKLRFQGTTGSSWQSDMAIDDLSLTTGGGGDTEPPSTPTGLIASNITTSSFDIAWNASTDNVGVTGYNVYLDGNLDGSTTATSYAFTGLTAATTYAVAVEAEDAAGNTSGQASINVTTDTGGGGCTNQTVDFNDLESGWGIWNDGGSDCRRSSRDAAYANSGSYCIRLRDNTSTSVATTDNINLSSFEDITVSFSYIARSMDNSNEDFWLQISTNGGSSYTTVEEWNQGDEFVNNVRENDAVTIPGPFTSNTRLRFRCDASGNSDWVYIDDIDISGCSTGTSSALVASAPPTDERLSLETSEIDLQDVTAYPNPVRSILKLANLPENSHVRVIDMTGRVVLNQTNISEIDMTGEKPGIYLVQITNEGETHVIRIKKE